MNTRMHVVVAVLAAAAFTSGGCLFDDWQYRPIAGDGSADADGGFVDERRLSMDAAIDVADDLVSQPPPDGRPSSD